MKGQLFKIDNRRVLQIDTTPWNDRQYLYTIYYKNENKWFGTLWFDTLQEALAGELAIIPASIEETDCLNKAAE